MWRLTSSSKHYSSDSHINISMSSYRRMTHDIHVLLADHDHKFVTSTIDKLNRFAYKVTAVNSASAALSMLSKKEVTYDVLIANILSPDLQGFKLLRVAVNMNLLVILLSDEDDAEMASRALEQGAFMLVDKPICEDTLKNLWQHVIRERNNKFQQSRANNKGIIIALDNNNNNYNKGKANDNYSDHEQHSVGGKRVRQSSNGWTTKYNRKGCIEWTTQLHQKFVEAVRQLGDGECYPKQILELMNVPGLTRMQVASHLQKCRYEKWRAPEERKVPTRNTSVCNGSSVATRSEQRRFGLMPRLATRSMEVQSSPQSVNNAVNINRSGFFEGESSRQPRQFLTVGSTYALDINDTFPSPNFGSSGESFDRDDGSFTSPSPLPRNERRMQSSDESLGFHNMEYDYLNQSFSNYNARQANNLSLHLFEYDKGFNTKQKEAKDQSSEPMNIPKASP